MPTPDESGLPPGWSQTDMLKTVEDSFGVGAGDKLPSGTRFLQNVVKLIRRRLAAGDEDGSKLALFLLSPSVPQGFEASCERIPILDTGTTKISGFFWFVTEVANMGRRLPIPGGLSDDEIFKFVADKLKLGSTQAIILDSRAGLPTVRFYGKGLDEPDFCEVVATGGIPIKLSDIFAAIERTYKSALATPHAHGEGGRLWKDAAKYHPISEAEARIQYALKVGLTNSFPSCVVREEQAMVGGRLDLEIEEADATNRTAITRHAILELKVLKSFFASGSKMTAKANSEWIKSGVTQANEYRIDRAAIAAALCCFDMRKEEVHHEDCFKHVRDEAKKLDVSLRVWRIFNAAKSFRQSNGALAGG